MDKDFVVSLEKFMNRLGITYGLEIDKSYYSRYGKQVCIQVVVYYKGEVQYDQYHCYGLRNGKPFYSEGNEVKGIDRGVLSYLGSDREIDNYFEDKARDIARKYLKQE